MRSNATIHARVQFQITGPSPHSMRRCDVESVFPQSVQRSVSAKRMAARRSLVGTISWITLYHVDFSWSVIQALCKLVQTCAHGMAGCLPGIRMSLFSLPARAIYCSIPYSRFLKVFSDCVAGWGNVRHVNRIISDTCHLGWDPVPVRRVR